MLRESQLYEKIVQLKMPAEDGKLRLTDVADTTQVLRIIQSIPSPKAEPFKLVAPGKGLEPLRARSPPAVLPFLALALICLISRLAR